MSEFSVGIRKVEDISILDLNGFLDAHTSTILENYINELMANQQVKLIMNFEKLQYISSAGLGVFMAYVEDIREKEGDIKLCGMSSKIFNVFELLGFPVLFEITQSELEAIEKFSV